MKGDRAKWAWQSSPWLGTFFWYTLVPFSAAGNLALPGSRTRPIMFADIQPQNCLFHPNNGLGV